VSQTPTNDAKGTRVPPELAPPDYCDPVIEAYKKDVDRTLLRENLKLSVEERFRKFKQFMKYVDGLRQAGRNAREQGIW
jgi:hypothetical protein